MRENSYGNRVAPLYCRQRGREVSETEQREIDICSVTSDLQGHGHCLLTSYVEIAAWNSCHVIVKEEVERNIEADIIRNGGGPPSQQNTKTIFRPVGFMQHINDLQTSCGHVKHVDDCTIWEKCSPAATIAHYKQQQPKSRSGRRPTKWHSITIRRWNYASVSRDHR